MYIDTQELHIITLIFELPLLALVFELNNAIYNSLAVKYKTIFLYDVSYVFSKHYQILKIFKTFFNAASLKDVVILKK